MGAHFVNSLLILAVCLQRENTAQHLLGGAIQVCSRSDPDLDECVVNSLNNARDAMANGMPKLNLAPLRDMVIPEVHLKPPPGIDGNVTASNVRWSGFQDFTVTDARIALEKPSIEIHTTWPKMNFNGHFKGIGRIFNLLLKGEGTFGIIIGKVNGTHIIDLDVVKGLDNHDHFRIKQYTFDMDFAEFQTNIEKLSEGDKQFGRMISQFVNTHWKEQNLVRNILRDAGLANCVKKVAEDFFNAVPVHRLLVP